MVILYFYLLSKQLPPPKVTVELVQLYPRIRGFRLSGETTRFQNIISHLLTGC